jgi:hypothetical protein
VLSPPSELIFFSSSSSARRTVWAFAHRTSNPSEGMAEPGVNSDVIFSWYDLDLLVSYTSSNILPDLLAFGYYAQCRCDPGGTLNYFTHLSMIVQVMQNHDCCPTSLLEILATERSRDRFTSEDLARAVAVLGFGADRTLRIDFDDDISDDFIESAWKECVKRSWRDHTLGSELLREANEALKIIAEARGSAKLRKVWETGKERMNPEKAYDTLEVPKDVDDLMLITVFNMRVRDFHLDAISPDPPLDGRASLPASEDERGIAGHCRGARQ